MELGTYVDAALADPKALRFVPTMAISVSSMSVAGSVSPPISSDICISLLSARFWRIVGGERNGIEMVENQITYA